MAISRLLVAVLALGAAACASDGKRDPLLPEQRLGVSLSDGLLELEHVDDSGFGRGEAMFHLRALRDGDEPVRSSVVFVWVPGEGGAAYERIESAFDTWMPPAAGRTHVLIAHAPDVAERQAAGQELRRAILRVESALRVPLVARTGGERGTTYLDGDLECVGFVFDRTASPQRLSVELQNVSEAAIEDAEYLVAVQGPGGLEVGRTEWTRIDALPARETTQIEVPLEGLEPGTGFGFVARRYRAERPRGPQVRTNPVGEELAGGLVKLLAVEDANLVSHGEVTFVVEGIEDGELPIEAYVEFTWSHDDHATEAAGLPQSDPLRRSEQRTLRARAPGWDAHRARGRRLVAARLVVLSGEFVPVVARRGDDPGSQFLGGALECVGVELDDRSLPFSIELENLSRAPVTGVEFRVLFVDATAQDTVGSTRWLAVPYVAAGGRIRLPVEVANGKATPDYMLYVRTKRQPR